MQAPRNVSVRIGSANTAVVLSCKVIRPPGAKLFWLMDGQPLHPGLSSQKHMQLVDDASQGLNLLIIHRLDHSHSARYTCVAAAVTADGQLTGDQASAWITVLKPRRRARSKPKSKLSGTTACGVLLGIDKKKTS